MLTRGGGVRGLGPTAYIKHRTEGLELDDGRYPSDYSQRKWMLEL